MIDFSYLKLIMVDLDGTLFDTRKVNWLAYQEAIKPYGYNIDYIYYCNYCNGRYYLDFLPQVTTQDRDILLDMHSRKKSAYSKYLSEARLNKPLVSLLYYLKDSCKLALVTTASRQNTNEILHTFSLGELFDHIVTHEDITKGKPDPEGYLKVMGFYNVQPEESLIFEDSDVGIKAAENAGVECCIVKGYN